QGLLRQILGESEAAFRRLQSEIAAAVGQNGQVLVDLLPDLSRVLGPQPSVPELRPAEAQNRLRVLFRSFLRVFTTAEHPMVLIVDDLHWADPASWSVLKLILLDPKSSHLLVIGTTSNEPGRAQLDRAVASFRAAVPVSELALGPLSRQDVGLLTAAA